MTGCDRGATQQFVFSVEPQMPLPPHDHRNNNSGEFAFSLYRLHTGLRQQPWQI